MSITFTPPVVPERRSKHPLWGRLEFPQGVSVIKEGDVYRQVQYPTEDDLALAEVIYLGEHTYTVTFAEAMALYEAGYGPFLTGFYAPGTPTPYGYGPYGYGPYGGKVS